jgi:hypothetical protein
MSNKKIFRQSVEILRISRQLADNFDSLAKKTLQSGGICTTVWQTMFASLAIIFASLPIIFATLSNIFRHAVENFSPCWRMASPCCRTFRHLVRFPL